MGDADLGNLDALKVGDVGLDILGNSEMRVWD